jgi:dTDP-glucose pyrophosphorylase/predicted transcriptional regulator
MRWGGNGSAELARLTVSAGATLRDVLRALDTGGESIVFVCDENGRAIGSVTDGDVRRALLTGADLDATQIEHVMRRDFLSVTSSSGRAEVLDLMRARGIGQVPIIDDAGRLRGLHTVGRLVSVRERPNIGVLLAGGRGTRLGALTHRIPKPMVTVAGRPILERLLLHMMSSGIREFYISVNYLAEIIEEHFGDGARFGCRIHYLRESRPLGTGGPLGLLPPSEHDIVVLNGDLVTQCDIGRMLDFHIDHAFDATIGVRPYSFEIPFGVARVEGSRLVALQEKPLVERTVSAGVYVLSPDMLRMIPHEEEYPITALIGCCLENGLAVGAFPIDEEWLDVGRPEELSRARGLS